MLRVLPIVLLLMMSEIIFADERILGVWMNGDDSIRLDILDGFKPNHGAVLEIKNGTEMRIGFWETKDSVTTIEIGWSSSEVNFLASDNFVWKNKSFKKHRDISEENDFVLLIQDESGFIDNLTRSVWLTSQEGRTSVFNITFSTDSGVVETQSSNGSVVELSSWGASSGVLKIGRDLIVEARISQNYMVGLNESDDF